MARPQKEGLDYFSLDVDFFTDSKIRSVRREYGNNGIVLYIYLLTRIYRNGYYLIFNDDELENAACEVGISLDATRQIVNYLVKRSLFNGTLFSTVKVLTSPGIQKRFQLGVRTRAQKTAVIVKRYWLLNEEETEPFIQVRPNPNSSWKNLDSSRKNPNSSREEYTKESKGKKSKGKESTHMPADAGKRASWHRVLDLFNRICVDLPRAKELTEKRAEAIQLVLEKMSEEQLEQIFRFVHESDFLCGRSGGWKASFDWILIPGNLTKIREGNYRNRPQKFQTGMWRSEAEVDYEEIEKRAQERLYKNDVR